MLTEQAQASGKPPAVIEKMVEGRIRKYYEEVVLLEQVWVHDGETRVKEVVKKAGGNLTGFQRFVLGEGDAPLLLFGGGSGITPMMSLIKSALKGPRRIRLFYANRDKQSVIFDAEFEALLAAHPGRLEIVHHLDATQGIIKPEEIVAAMKGFEAGDVYLCGPGPFMKLVEETLFEHGMPHEKVRIERFEASGNDAIPIQPSEQGDVVPGEITIHFEGKVHKVAYAKGQTILEAALAGGLNPLSSCEEGFCASCAAKTIKGKVMLAKNDIYTPEDLANNWILTCQGHCFGAEVEITYDVV